MHSIQGFLTWQSKLLTKYKHISQAEIYQIYALMKAGHDQTQIAKLLDRQKSRASADTRCALEQHKTLLNVGSSLPQIVVRAGWTKTDTVMRYVDRVRPGTTHHTKNLVLGSLTQDPLYD